MRPALVISFLLMAFAIALLASTSSAESLASSDSNEAFDDSDFEGTLDIERKGKGRKFQRNPKKHRAPRKKTTKKTTTPKPQNKVARKSTCGVGLVGSCVKAASLVCGSKKCCPKIRFGVDSNEATLVPSRLHAGGATFLVRYISQQATAPMTVDEVRFWRGNNMDLVAVWEMGRLRPVEGGSNAQNFKNGAQDAKLARSRMNSYGAKGKPVYFAADAFINPKNPGAKPAGTVILSFNAIIPYFKGILSVLPLSQVGAYGSYTAIKGLLDRKLIKYAWQASSFDSNGRLDPRSHLYQCSTLPPDPFGSGQLDYDFALTKDFGQWRSQL